MKTKTLKRTIENACCIYCDRPFVYAPLSEIVEHMETIPVSPFRTGTVYVSQKGYNIITAKGKPVDGLGFCEHRLHDYIHQVATGKQDSSLGIYFEDNLKTRTVLDLEERFRTRQIRIPTLLEMAEFQESFAKYLESKGRGSTTNVWDELKEIKPEKLAIAKRALFF